MKGAGRDKRTPRFPALERRLAGEVLRQAARGGLVWAALAISAWCIGNAAFIILNPPWWAGTGLALALLSVAPAFAFPAIREGGLFSLLRRLDEKTTMEAALTAPPGPAASLLMEKASLVDGEIPFKAAGGSNPLRGLGPMWMAAILALALLQLSALLILHRPALSYVPPPAASGSGIASTDPGLDRSAAVDPDALRRPAPPEPLRPETATGAQTIRAAPGASGHEGGLDLFREERLARAEDEGQAAANDAGAAGKGGPPIPSGESPQGRQAGQATEGKAAPKDKSGSLVGKGYESSEGGLPPSPLIDYKARLFQALTERGGGTVAAGDTLDLAALRSYEQRYFASFSIPSGLSPREDAYTGMLKRRWLSAKEALK